MSRRQLAIAQVVLNILRQGQQAQKVGDVGPALAQSLGQPVLRVIEPVHQLPVAHRLLDRVQIGALDVLDDRDFQNLGIVEVAHQNRNFVQLRHLGRAPAAFAGNDLEHLGPSGIRAHDQRLDDSLLGNGIGQSCKAPA